MQLKGKEQFKNFTKMISELSNRQIERVLTSGIVGRLACCYKNVPYVVPIVYVLDGDYIYAHSQEGQKIKFMRENPSVCLLVDEIDSMANWRSVVVTGKYEELKTVAAKKAAAYLINELTEPLIASSATRRPHRESNPPFVVKKGRRAIYFRIKIISASGRYEKPA